MQHIKGKAVLTEYGSAWLCHNCKCMNVHWDHDVHKSPWCLHIYLPPLLSTDRHWGQQCSCVFVGLHVRPLARSLLQTVFMRMYVLNVWVLKASISSQSEGELVSETSHIQCLRCSMLFDAEWWTMPLCWAAWGICKHSMSFDVNIKVQSHWHRYIGYLSQMLWI